MLRPPRRPITEPVRSYSPEVAAVPCNWNPKTNAVCLRKPGAKIGFDSGEVSGSAGDDGTDCGARVDFNPLQPGDDRSRCPPSTSIMKPNMNAVQPCIDDGVDTTCDGTKRLRDVGVTNTGGATQSEDQADSPPSAFRLEALVPGLTPGKRLVRERGARVARSTSVAIDHCP